MRLPAGSPPIIDLTELHSGNLWPEMGRAIKEAPPPKVVLYGIGPQWVLFRLAPGVL